MADEYPLTKFLVNVSTSQPLRNISGDFHDLVDVDETFDFQSFYTDADGNYRALFIGSPQTADFTIIDGENTTSVGGFDKGIVLTSNPYEPPEDPAATISDQFLACVKILGDVQGVTYSKVGNIIGSTAFLNTKLDPTPSTNETCLTRIKAIEQESDGFFILRYEGFGSATKLVPYLVQSSYLDSFLSGKGVITLSLGYYTGPIIEAIKVTKNQIIPYNKVKITGPSVKNSVTGIMEKPSATATSEMASILPLCYVENLSALPSWATTLQQVADKRLADINRPRYTFPIKEDGLIYAELYQPVSLVGFPLASVLTGTFRVIGIQWQNDEGFFTTTFTISNAIISKSSEEAYNRVTGSNWLHPNGDAEVISMIAREAVRKAPEEMVGDTKAIMGTVKETNTTTKITTLETHLGREMEVSTPYTTETGINPNDRFVTLPIAGEVIAIPITNAPVFGEYILGSEGEDSTGDYCDIYSPDHTDIKKRRVRVYMPHLDPATLRANERIHAIPVGGNYYGTLAEPARAVIGTITEIDGVTGLAKATDLKDASKTYEEIIPYSEDMTWPT